MAIGVPISQDERDELLRNCDELEAAVFEVMTGKRKPGKLPIEPMTRLIHYARTGTIRNATLKNPAIPEGER